MLMALANKETDVQTKYLMMSGVPCWAPATCEISFQSYTPIAGSSSEMAQHISYSHILCF